MSVWTFCEEKLVWFCNMNIIAAWISCADLRVQVSGVHYITPYTLGAVSHY